MTLREEYLRNNGGDVDAAMVEMVAGLMEGDPDRFKVGYTERNAVLAVADVFGVDESVTQAAVDKVKADELTLDEQRRREQADRTARMNALHTGTYKAGE